MRFKIERISNNNIDCCLLNENNRVVVNFGNIQHTLKDYYNLKNCNYNNENIFKSLNRIIKLLDDSKQNLLFKNYESIISIINTEHSVDRITEPLHKIIKILLEVSSEEILTKEDVINLSLLYHAANFELKEEINKEEYFEIIKLGIILKCILPIINYYHFKWLNVNTLSIYLVLNNVLRFFPNLLSSLNIVRNTIKSNCSINEFEYYCLLIEENIYLHDLPYYDLTYLTEDNNILNIINKDVIDKIKIVSNLFLEYDIEKL